MLDYKKDWIDTPHVYTGKKDDGWTQAPLNVVNLYRDLGYVIVALFMFHLFPLLRIPLTSYGLEVNHFLALVTPVFIILAYWPILLYKQAQLSSEQIGKYFLIIVLTFGLLMLGHGLLLSSAATNHVTTSHFSNLSTAHKQYNTIKETHLAYENGNHFNAFAIDENITIHLDNTPNFCMWTLTKTYFLNKFYKEYLGAYIENASFNLLDFVTLMSHWTIYFQPSNKRKHSFMLLAYGCISGFFLFFRTVEGGTWFFTVPIAILVCWVCGMKYLQKNISGVQPVVGFFLTQYLFSLLFIVIWALMHMGLPSFSKLGFL